MHLSTEDRQAMVDKAAEIIAAQATAEIMEAFGFGLGDSALIPVSLAVRMTGWSDTLIRKIIPLVEVHGQVASVQISDLKKAINDRKNK